MVEGVQHFAAKSIGLSRCGGRKPSTLLTAARHNLREIQAELGAHGRIDARRTAGNTRLAGPATAAEVVALADRLLVSVDTSKLKRDHVQAVEVVFSLKLGSTIDAPVYFARCLAWTEQALRLPVLLATVHTDEAAPHLHVLLLPLRDGKHIGGAANARPELKRLRESFFAEVAGPAGLKRDSARLYGQAKQWAVDAVFQHCQAQDMPNACAALWPLLESAIKRDPLQCLRLLNITPDSIRPNAPRPIGLEDGPIGLAIGGRKHQALSCVGLASQSPLTTATNDAQVTGQPTPAQPVITRLAAPCAVVDRHSERVTRKPERMAVAHQAQQAAIAKHPPPQRSAARPAPIAEVSNFDGVTRTTEHAHDLSAWH
jgi:hypothetical protein